MRVFLFSVQNLGFPKFTDCTSVNALAFFFKKISKDRTTPAKLYSLRTTVLTRFEGNAPIPVDFRSFACVAPVTIITQISRTRPCTRTDCASFSWQQAQVTTRMLFSVKSSIRLRANVTLIAESVTKFDVGVGSWARHQELCHQPVPKFVALLLDVKLR